MKAKRFMIEYANYKIKCLEACSEMNKGIKNELIRRIDKTIFNYEHGFITVDECMRLLSLPDTGEDMSVYAS